MEKEFKKEKTPLGKKVCTIEIIAVTGNAPFNILSSIVF